VSSLPDYFTGANRKERNYLGQSVSLRRVVSCLQLPHFDPLLPGSSIHAVENKVSKNEYAVEWFHRRILSVRSTKQTMKEEWCLLISDASQGSNSSLTVLALIERSFVLLGTAEEQAVPRCGRGSPKASNAFSTKVRLTIKTIPQINCAG
jgi:hypothetical protein